ncbi:MAG TPA: hypothetical protein VF622_00030 [Segetibacter sp.]|jgi:hypothetical protein
MKNVLTVSLFCCLFSCTKSNEERRLTDGIYESQGQQFRYLPEMYTSNGKITDTSIIYRYLRLKSQFFFSNYDQLLASVPQLIPYTDTIRITISGQEGILYMRDYMHPGTPNNPENYQTHVVAINASAPSEILLEHKDSTVIAKSLTSSPCNSLNTQLNKYMPDQNCRAMGTIEVCSYKDITPIQPVSETEIKVLLYARQSSNSSCAVFNMPIFNVPSLNIQKLLTPADTVVIQRREIILKRRQS